MMVVMIRLGNSLSAHCGEAEAQVEGDLARQVGAEVALLDGDASTMMHLSDFDTAVRYKIPLLIVVLNDQALGSEYQKMVAHNMRAELSAIPTPDMGNVAIAYGGRGRFARTIDEVIETLHARGLNLRDD